VISSISGDDKHGKDVNQAVTVWGCADIRILFQGGSTLDGKVHAPSSWPRRCGGVGWREIASHPRTQRLNRLVSTTTVVFVAKSSNRPGHLQHFGALHIGVPPIPAARPCICW